MASLARPALSCAPAYLKPRNRNADDGLPAQRGRFHRSPMRCHRSEPPRMSSRDGRVRTRFSHDRIMQANASARSCAHASGEKPTQLREPNTCLGLSGGRARPVWSPGHCPSAPGSRAAHLRLSETRVSASGPAWIRTKDQGIMSPARRDATRRNSVQRCVIALQRRCNDVRGRQREETKRYAQCTRSRCLI